MEVIDLRDDKVGMKTERKMTIWDSMRNSARNVAKSTEIAAKKTKIRADIMLIDREIKARKQVFGVDLFNLMEETEIKEGDNFWIKHNEAVLSIKDTYLTAKQEIHEYVGRINGKVQQLNFVEEKRANEFQEEAKTFSEKMKNAQKTVNMAGSEAKLRSQMALMNSKIKARKEKFGVEAYVFLAHLEDTKGVIPTDRAMRSCYDTARQEVIKIEERKGEKIKAFQALGGSIKSLEAPQPPPPIQQQQIVAAKPSISNTQQVENRQEEENTESSANSDSPVNNSKAEVDKVVKQDNEEEDGMDDVSVEDNANPNVI